MPLAIVLSTQRSSTSNQNITGNQIMDGMTTTGVSNSPETAKNFMLNSSASVTQVGMPTPSTSHFQIPLIKMKAKGLKNNNKMYLRTAGKQIASPHASQIGVSTILEEHTSTKTKSGKNLKLKLRKTTNTSS